MTKAVIQNGLISAGILVVCSLIPWMLGGFDKFNYHTMEVFGYLIMLASLSFVFIGIRQYKTRVEKRVGFSEALKVGLLIVIFPAVAFFIYTAIFMNVMGEDFLQYSITQMQQSMPAKDFEKYKAELDKNKDLYLNPFFQGFIMFITVYAIGFIVALISAWILTRKK